MQLLGSRVRLLVVTALAGLSVTFLVMTPPSLPAGAWARGDDVAIAAAWAIALAASAWLFASSAACLVAIGAHRPHLARAFARGLPRSLRRSVEVAIVASCLAVSAAPAYAANSKPAGVLDQPVVRGVRSLVVPPSTASAVAPRTAPPAPRTTVAVRVTPTAPSTRPAPSPRPSPTTSIAAAPSHRSTPARTRHQVGGATVPSSSPPNSAQSAHDARVVVPPGDNLWLIARAEVIRNTGTYPNDAEVARYWRAVIDANRSTLRSGNPSLIFPGEIVALPPVS